jgi:hypothetical protein
MSFSKKNINLCCLIKRRKLKRHKLPYFFLVHAHKKKGNGSRTFQGSSLIWKHKYHLQLGKKNVWLYTLKPYSLVLGIPFLE